jgi:hypothetical protein
VKPSPASAGGLATAALVPLAACAALLLAPAAQAAEARLVACDVVARAATFEGRMAARPEAARMQMRFTLQARMPERAAWTRVPAPGLDVWTTAEPDVDRYVYTKRVEGLVGPGRYRAVIRFRWTDAAGLVRAHAREISPACRQPA